MAVKFVLVDLGGTLVDFMGTMHHVQLVPQALASTTAYLVSIGLEVPPADVVENGWNDARRDPEDHRVKPLEDRLAMIYGIRPDDRKTLDGACRAFVAKLHSNARTFDDAIPFLTAVRSRGQRTVLVSNTTWGSPAHIWREELARRGLDKYLDRTVFCRDVGWRKPDRRVYEHLIGLTGAEPSNCLFVGDDPSWDYEGPRRTGMRAVLLDRGLQYVGQRYERVTNLLEIVESGALDR